jgi:hypothetical protein
MRGGPGAAERASTRPAASPLLDDESGPARDIAARGEVDGGRGERARETARRSVTVGRFAQRQVQGGEGGKSEGARRRARREVNEGSEARARARVALQRGGGPPSGPAWTHELKPFTLGLGTTDISQGSWSSAKGSSQPSLALCMADEGRRPAAQWVEPPVTRRPDRSTARRLASGDRRDS